MSEPNSVEYYRQREQRERELAERAFDPQIGRIHREMAERYADLLQRTRPVLRMNI